MSELEIANIVASGRLGVELDLAAVASSEKLNQDSRIESIEHSQKSGQRVLVRFSDGPVLGILSRKGACIITGAKSYDRVSKTKEDFLGALHDAEVVPHEDIKEFEIQNIVFTTTLNEPVDLNALAIVLGFERVEYEPEQFPGLVFRPENTSCVILVFGSGKVVITGGRSEEEAKKAISKLKKEISAIQA
jgi:transcription initiation factor TFIID TATA-box-binding protein